MPCTRVILSRLPRENVRRLRRFAKYWGVRKWWALRKLELIKEITWKIDPWKDTGMY